MSRQFLEIIILCSASFFLLSCSSSSSTTRGIAAPIELSEWETRLPGEQGEVKITFILPQHAQAEFQLFDGKPSDLNSAVAQLSLNDKNCTSGHLGSIQYSQGDSESFFRYFSKEAVWNQTNTITLQWSSNKQITATLNGEINTINTYGQVDRLKIISKIAPIRIQKLEILPQ